jgi:hypothetical protein
MKKLIFLSFMFIFFQTVHAAYLVNGKVEGNVCSGTIVKTCKFEDLHAIKGSDGNLYTITNSFESVTEYNQSKNRCWINIKGRGIGVISWGINAAVQPDFYEKTSSGEFKKVDVDFITFKCIKR